MTPDDMRTVTGRVLDGNFKRTLRMLGEIAGFDFGREHWNAIATGLRRTNPETDRWYDYEFNGRHLVRLRCAAYRRKPGVCIRAEVPVVLEPQVQVLMAIVSRYQLRSKHYRRLIAPPSPPERKPPPG